MPYENRASGRWAHRNPTTQTQSHYLKKQAELENALFSPTFSPESAGLKPGVELTLITVLLLLAQVAPAHASPAEQNSKPKTRTFSDVCTGHMTVDKSLTPAQSIHCHDTLASVSASAGRNIPISLFPLNHCIHFLIRNTHPSNIIFSTQQ